MKQSLQGSEARMFSHTILATSQVVRFLMILSTTIMIYIIYNYIIYYYIIIFVSSPFERKLDHIEVE